MSYRENQILSTLDKLYKLFYRLLDIMLVVCMIVMLVLVFSNAVMRFGFNSGIDIAEELPRFMFVWLTFIGAVVGLRENRHIGVTTFVARLSLPGKQLCWLISQLLILLCCGYMFYSTYLQHNIIKDTISAVMQISMLWIYGVSYIASIAMGLHVVCNLIRLFTGQVAESELVTSFEEVVIENVDENDLAIREGSK